MSSISGGSHSGGENEDIEADVSIRNKHGRSAESTEGTKAEIEDGEVEFGEFERDALIEDAALEDEGLPEDRELAERAQELQDDYPHLDREQTGTPDDLVPDARPVTPTPGSPVGSPDDSGSIPDDTPSQHGSLLSSPGRVASPVPRKHASRTPSGALQPFERRFEARAAMSKSPSSRGASPGFLTPHSRQISLSSQISQISSQEGSAETETPQAPWDVIRWTKLRKLSGQVFSEAGRRNFGRPTCVAVSALIAIGTSKGLILGFDYHQTLKIIIGQGTKATECGSITALAIAADYSTIASGHANGHIFTWEVNRPSQPFLRIPPIDPRSLQTSNHDDGHLESSAILHIGFLGTRHTAVVSADAMGMAFSHLATRGLGPVTRTIKSTRLLGRYPPSDPQAERSRKPSSVLAFSPLPLGNVEQPTDGIGLTALLTPYLLVIVSTTPIAQTQHKASRPKEISPHSTLSGCLAWFPAVKLKRPGSEKNVSDTKLVYCWANILTVLDVHVVNVDETADSNKPPTLEFHARSRWRAEEAIVAVQWLGRSVLGVLTISQRLLIVEDGSLQVTDSIDLLHRHIYHQDLFSTQLQSVVEQLNSADPSLHGVVADAFYMSFRVYKGRTFLLGYNDLTVGTLSNWADRLIALMDAGDYIAAIRLATEYYDGSASNITVGLPEDSTIRHEMVRERLISMIKASLDYTFSQHDDERDVRLRELATACFDACMKMQENDFLFGSVFDTFEEADDEAMFISTLEPYVLDGEVQTIPPEVVKTLVSHYISDNQAARLEELLCRLDPNSFDLDQITMLCRQHRLYDALIYVWTQAIGDFVTPLIELLYVVQLLQSGDEDEDLSENPFYESAMKVFPYLAYSLTSRKYPSGDLMSDSEASHSKADLYEYLLSGKPLAWPEGSKKVFQTTANPQDEPAFPYLVLLLQFDAPSFMSMLNEAFEDSFLNSADDVSGPNGYTQINGVSSRPGYKMTRDRIISIMLDVMKQEGFSPDQMTYLDMFIARSVPKYPEEVVLPGSLLNTVLEHLCQPPSDELRDDCQLSVEYLLSTYHPPDVTWLIDALLQAQFYRVLKSVYRQAKMFTELLNIYFQDPDDKAGVFDCMAYCLRPSTGLSEKQVHAVKTIISSNVTELAGISTTLTARTLAAYAPDLLQPSVGALHDSYVQFVFLRALLEPALLLRHELLPSFSPLAQEQQYAFTEQYVQLMCKYDPTHVSDYIGILPSSNLRLERVLPAMEASGIVDAAVVLLARDGLVRDAMDRLVSHLEKVQQHLGDIVNAAAQSPDLATTREAAVDLVSSIEKYTKVGIWLCQGQSANTERRPRPRTNFAWDIKEDDLDLDEFVWLNLIDVVVRITRHISQALEYVDDHPSEISDALDSSKISTALRSNVQQTFTALLAATATPKVEKSDGKQIRQRSHDHLSFLRVFRAFLTRAATTAPSLSDLRTVLSDIFSAYTFEEGVLSLAHDLLGSDVFEEIKEANEQRQHGWRPRTQVCELCKRRAWGPGIGETVWNEWVAREQDREATKTRKVVERGGGEQARRLERGKAKANAATVVGSGETQSEDIRRLALVVFSCRHVFHRVCLDEDYKDGEPPKQTRYKCPLCIEHD